MHPAIVSEAERFGAADWPAAAGAEIGRQALAVLQMPVMFNFTQASRAASLAGRKALQYASASRCRAQQSAAGVWMARSGEDPAVRCCAVALLRQGFGTPPPPACAAFSLLCARAARSIGFATRTISASSGRSAVGATSLSLSQPTSLTSPPKRRISARRLAASAVISRSRRVRRHNRQPGRGSLSLPATLQRCNSRRACRGSAGSRSPQASDRPAQYARDGPSGFRC
jgi:hypothetical protein